MTWFQTLLAIAATTLFVVGAIQLSPLQFFGFGNHRVSWAFAYTLAAVFGVITWP